MIHYNWQHLALDPASEFCRSSILRRKIQMCERRGFGKRIRRILRFCAWTITTQCKENQSSISIESKDKFNKKKGWQQHSSPAALTEFLKPKALCDLPAQSSHVCLCVWEGGQPDDSIRPCPTSVVLPLSYLAVTCPPHTHRR